ncbi:hypothetical protein D3C81_2028340 [compost metagenome]
MLTASTTSITTFYLSLCVNITSLSVSLDTPECSLGTLTDKLTFLFCQCGIYVQLESISVRHGRHLELHGFHQLCYVRDTTG